MKGEKAVILLSYGERITYEEPNLYFIHDRCLTAYKRILAGQDKASVSKQVVYYTDGYHVSLYGGMEYCNIKDIINAHSK